MNTTTASGVPPFMDASMEQARLGVLYLFGHMRCEDTYFKILTHGVLDVADSSMSYYRENVRVADSRTFTVPTGGGHTLTGSIEEVKDKIVDTLMDWCGRLVDDIDRRVTGKPSAQPSLRQALKARWGHVLEGLCEKLASKLLGAFYGYTKSAYKALGSIVKAVKAGFERYATYQQGLGVQVLPGLPETVVKGILACMDRTLAGTTYEALSKTVNFTLQVAANVAQGLASLVVSVVEAVVHTVWTICEMSRFTQFCNEASYHWQQRTGASPWHRDPDRFNPWFSTAVRRVPAIAALALRSGLCGDKMHFLRMIDESGQVLSDAAYRRGFDYVETLREHGRKYLANLGYAVGSTDPGLAVLVSAEGIVKDMSAAQQAEALKKLNRA